MVLTKVDVVRAIVVDVRDDVTPIITGVCFPGPFSPFKTSKFNICLRVADVTVPPAAGFEVGLVEPVPVASSPLLIDGRVPRVVTGESPDGGPPSGTVDRSSRHAFASLSSKFAEVFRTRSSAIPCG